MVGLISQIILLNVQFDRHSQNSHRAWLSILHQSASIENRKPGQDPILHGCGDLVNQERLEKHSHPKCGLSCRVALNRDLEACIGYFIRI